MYQQYQKCIIRLSGIWNTHTHTHTLGTIQMYFWAQCCLQGSFVQRVADGMLQTAVYSEAGSYWISARLTTFFTVCASAEFSRVYSVGQRGAILPDITLNPLSNPPACSEDVIFQGPRWKTEPSDLILPINTPDQRTTITCEAEGSPPPQYR